MTFSYCKIKMPEGVFDMSAPETVQLSGVNRETLNFKFNEFLTANLVPTGA